MGCKVNSKTDSLQGKAIQFLTKKGQANIAKVLDESSVTVSNTKRFRNSAKLLSMLEDVSSLFKKHGLFIHKGDNNIMRRNADLMENLVDVDRLMTRINDKAGFTSNVVTATKVDGSYWLKTTDEFYDKEASFETHEKRRANIIKRNKEYIAKVNAHFKAVTGRQAIKIGKNNRLRINQTVLQDFNTQSYVHYVNSMYQYFNGNKAVEEDLIISPLTYKLDLERKDLIKTKQQLSSRGGKKADINILDNSINQVSEKIKELEDSATLEDVWDYAKEDIATVDKLLEKDAISSAEFNIAKRKLDVWTLAGNFTRQDEEGNITHPFLDAEELENLHYQEQFIEIRGEAEARIIQLMDRGRSLLETAVNDELEAPDRLSFNKILQLPHKLNLFTKTALSLNTVGQSLAQFIHKIVNKANHNAFTAAKRKSRDLADSYKAVKDSGFNLDNFYQKNDAGTRTGRLTHKFSNTFFQSIGGIKGTVAKYKKEMLMLNPSVLFGEDQQAKESFLHELTQHLGEKETSKYVAKAQEKFEDYNEIRSEFIREEFGEGELTTEDEAILKEWEFNNSPVEYIKAIQTTKKKATSEVKGKDTFMVAVPRRFHKTGKETNWYDSNFNEIEASETAYDFYQMAEEITNNTQAAHGNTAFTSTSIAFIQRNVLDQWNGIGGIKDYITKDFYDHVIKSITTTDPTAESINPLTGVKEKTVRSNLTALDKVISGKYKHLLEQAGGKTNTTPKQRQDLMNKASDETFLENKDNLFMALNLMNLASLTLEHKHNIEDVVNLATTYLPKSTVKVDNEYIDSAGNPVAAEYINDMKEMINHFLDMSYYSEGIVDVSSRIGGKLKTTKEKQRTKEIEKELEAEETTPAQIMTLQKELGEMGSRATVNTVGKKLLGHVRLVNLGWNLSAGIANLAYGFITNLYKAADGRMYNFREFGNAVRAMTTERKKFNHVLENYNILGDITYSFEEANKFEEKKNWFFRAIKKLAPYELQTKTEKLNQGSVMIAMMLHQKVKSSKTGEEISMWEAIDSEGRLGEEWTIGESSGEEVMANMIGKIKSQVEETHGDYSNPLLIKKSLGGKALSMHKGWFAALANDRFGKEKFDYIRGINTKGKYRTLRDIIVQHKFNLRKAYKAYKNNELSEVDAANLRNNFAEIVSIILMYGIYGLLKNAFCGDSKSCKEANALQLYTINIAKRLSNETQFYMNPKEWYNFVSNPVAAARVLKDMTSLAEIAGTSVFGDEEEKYYQRGFYEGRHKLEVWLKKQTPFINQYERAKKYGDELINL